MNKKGFTLIELLAVIVILAIIALIAVPIVLSIISDSKESASLRSAEMYLKGLETSVATATLNEKNITDGTYSIMNNGNICLGTITNNTCSEEETLKVEMNGETPVSGSVTIESGKVKDIAFTYSSGKTIVKDANGNLVYEGNNTNTTYESIGNWEHKLSDGTIESHDTESGKCSKCGENVLAPGLYDENDELLYSWHDLGLEIELDVIPPQNTTVKKINSIPNGVKLVVADGITKIGSYQFNAVDKGTDIQCNITEIVLPNSVISINDTAFQNATKLKSINIPKNITSIGGSFSMSGIENLIIPDGVLILNGTFMEMRELKSVTIPNSVTSFGVGTFSTLIDKLEVNYIGTIEQWNNIVKDDEWRYSTQEIIIHCTDGDIDLPKTEW